jgi:hypothetical protein
LLPPHLQPTTIATFFPWQLGIKRKQEKKRIFETITQCPSVSQPGMSIHELKTGAVKAEETTSLGDTDKVSREIGLKKGPYKLELINSFQ